MQAAGLSMHEKSAGCRWSMTQSEQGPHLVHVIAIVSHGEGSPASLDCLREQLPGVPFGCIDQVGCHVTQRGLLALHQILGGGIGCKLALFALIQDAVLGQHPQHLVQMLPPILILNACLVCQLQPQSRQSAAGEAQAHA